MGMIGRVQVAVLTAGLALVALTGCATAAPAATPTRDTEPRFKTAVVNCGLSTASGGVEYGDAGRTLILRTQTDDIHPEVDWTMVNCVMHKLRATEATMNVISETRAIDGRQNKSWDGIDASWSYHPDEGLNVTLEDTKR